MKWYYPLKTSGLLWGIMSFTFAPIIKPQNYKSSSTRCTCQKNTMGLGLSPCLNSCPSMECLASSQQTDLISTKQQHPFNVHQVIRHHLKSAWYKILNIGKIWNVSFVKKSLKIWSLNLIVFLCFYIPRLFIAGQVDL